MKSIYLDNAATTQISDEVIDAMTAVMKQQYGNASSTHSFGRASKALVEKSRKIIAGFLNVSAGEIIFTSGGTEADNLVLISAVRDLKVKHIITSKIEHHAVLHTVERLQAEYSISISYVAIDKNGQIDYLHLQELLENPNKTLVSLMHVNNEIGNILDMQRVALLCKANKALFHSDTVQSVGRYPLNLQEIPVDFIAASAHKFHGPKGVGFAFIRKNSGLRPLIYGGEQERGLRAGTESVHNIVGIEKAISRAHATMEHQHAYIQDLKLHFINRLKKEIPLATFNGYSGDIEKSTYTIVNVCLPVSAEHAAMLLFQLDLKGIACSKGSACQSGSIQSSHVLAELLSEADLQKPSIRFSFSTYNTKEEIDFVIEQLKTLIVT